MDFNEFLLKSILNEEEHFKGGRADGMPDSDFDPEQLKKGIEIELEHTSDRDAAEEIAKDHLRENSKYYDLLDKMEKDAGIKEEQSAAERYKKHKEWRRKNPEKVRAQVKRHEMKSRSNPSDPQTGHQAAREDTRQDKENGKKKKNPKCSNCGSTVNVQYDHQNGQRDRKNVKPLCHKCHTKRPQQNKPGEKSVKGAVVKASRNKKELSSFELFLEELNKIDDE